tara:strand:- start:88 stop:615 length:528 start_codon:yes stop_codon:yes gene_type:complete
MIEWIDILTGLAIVLAFLAIGLLFLVVVASARRLFPRRKPVQLILQKEIKKEKPQMSKEKGEGVTFNDVFMFMIAVPLVLLWVGFAGFVIHSGLNDAAVLEQIEGYTTLIAILGGPALLIIKDALDVWKQEQAEKTAFYKVKAQAVIDYNDSMQKQAQMIEAKAQEQEHKMEMKK